jgi:hypothetical protein
MRVAVRDVERSLFVEAKAMWTCELPVQRFRLRTVTALEWMAGDVIPRP